MCHIYELSVKQSTWWHITDYVNTMTVDLIFFSWSLFRDDIYKVLLTFLHVYPVCEPKSSGEEQESFSIIYWVI